MKRSCGDAGKEKGGHLLCISSTIQRRRIQNVWLRRKALQILVVRRKEEKRWCGNTDMRRSGERHDTGRRINLRIVKIKIVMEKKVRNTFSVYASQIGMPKEMGSRNGLHKSDWRLAGG